MLIVVFLHDSLGFLADHTNSCTIGTLWCPSSSFMGAQYAI